MIPEAQEYILANCDQDRSGCWLWNRSRNNADYGNANWGKKRMGAHVLSHLAFNGDIPEGWQVDHRRSCPKWCVNPAHLTAVTRAMNQHLYWRRLRGQFSRRDVRISRWMHNQVTERLRGRFGADLRI